LKHGIEILILVDFAKRVPLFSICGPIENGWFVESKAVTEMFLETPKVPCTKAAPQGWKLSHYKQSKIKLILELGVEETFFLEQH
jgi:hypothetical protein